MCPTLGFRRRWQCMEQTMCGLLRLPPNLVWSTIRTSLVNSNMWICRFSIFRWFRWWYSPLSSRCLDECLCMFSLLCLFAESMSYQWKCWTSMLKLTVLESYLEVDSETGTVGKLWTSSLAALWQFSVLETSFWAFLRNVPELLTEKRICSVFSRDSY